MPYNAESARRNRSRLKDEIIAELQAEGWTIRPPTGPAPGKADPLCGPGDPYPQDRVGGSRAICRRCEAPLINERWHLQ